MIRRHFVQQDQEQEQEQAAEAEGISDTDHSPCNNRRFACPTFCHPLQQRQWQQWQQQQQQRQQRQWQQRQQQQQGSLRTWIVPPAGRQVQGCAALKVSSL